MRIIEITDDLTGAVDSGSYFSGRNEKIHVFTSAENIELCNDGEMMSVNLSSRNIDQAMAENLHYETFCKLKDLLGDSIKDTVFVKKIGTGFRGNDSMELQGLLRADEEFLIFVIDNAPDLGTFTLYGNQYCEGEILTKSLYANDPIMPPKESYIPSILSKNSSIKVGLVDIDSVKSGLISERVAEVIDNGCRIVVFDAVTREDTLNIIKCLFPIYKKVFWTGSLGMADGLAQYLLGDWEQNRIEKRYIKSLCFCASAYPICVKQIEYSRQRGMNVVEIDIDRFIEGFPGICEEVVNTAKDSIKNNNTMIVPKVDRYSYKKGTNLKILEAVREVASVLCEETVDDFERLVVIGGETSQNIFAVTKTYTLILGKPIQPGVAQGLIADGVLKGREFALKGGSMGQEDTLEKMLCKCEVNY